MTFARRGSIRVRLSSASSSAQSEKAGVRVGGRNLIQIDCRRMLDADSAAPALRGSPCTRGVDEDAPHDLGRQREEMHAIVPVDVLGIDQTKVGLVNERRALQRHA